MVHIKKRLYWICYDTVSVLYLVSVFFGNKACRILALGPGIKPTPPPLEGRVLTAEPPGTSLGHFQGGPMISRVLEGIWCSPLASFPFPLGPLRWGGACPSSRGLTVDLVSPEFSLFHMIAVGLSSSILGCLLTLLVYTYCQRYQQQSHDATVIHPVAPAPLNTSITNHINKLDKYDSVEAIKVGTTAPCCSEACQGGRHYPGGCRQSPAVAMQGTGWCTPRGGVGARWMTSLIFPVNVSFIYWKTVD